MKLGAISVRLELDALHNLQAVLRQAAQKLSGIKSYRHLKRLAFRQTRPALAVPVYLYPASQAVVKGLAV